MNALPSTTLQQGTALALRSRIARAFGRGAASYDQHAGLQRQVADRLLAMLPEPEPAMQMLDLGCGTGYCSTRLRQLQPAASVLALDLALPMLAVANRQLNAAPAQVQMLCADAQALPLRDSSVDVLVSSLALQWCSDPTAVFAEIQRVLKPGALALVSTLGPASLQEMRAAWAAVDAKRHSNEFLPAWQLQQAAAAVGLQLQLEQEIWVRHYRSLLALAQELKGLGANVVAHAQAEVTTTPAAFKAAAAVFARGLQPDGIPVRWEILCLALRKKPQDSPR